MTTDLDKLFPVTKGHIKPAVETLTKAFKNDLVYSFIIPDEKKRNELLPYFFQFRVRYGLLYGEAYAISPDVEGIAIWLPYKNVDMTPVRMARSGGISLFFRAGKDAMTRLSSLGDHLSKLHKKHADFPHWYLAPIGVNPVFQGKGYGAALIKAMLDRLDKEGLPCFLQTQSEYNVSIYEKYGFKVVEKSIVPSTDLTNWDMLRDV